MDVKVIKNTYFYNRKSCEVCNSHKTLFEVSIMGIDWDNGPAPIGLFCYCEACVNGSVDEAEELGRLHWSLRIL